MSGSTPKQIRYGQVGLSDDGQRYIDMIVKVTRGNYVAKPTAVKERNGANGLVGQINMGVTLTSSSPTQGTSTKVELEFAFVRSGTDIPEVLDIFSMKFLDIDRDAALTLRESVCVDLDQLDPTGFETVIPGYAPSSGNICAFGTCLFAYCQADPEIGFFSSTTKDCWDQTSNSGSVGINSVKVGFQCDNPKSAIDASPTKCSDCFSPTACADGGSKTDFFPADTGICPKCSNVAGGRCINPELRSMNLGFRAKSSFKVTMELECLKKYNKALSSDKNSCSRNFIFSGKHLRCDYPSWDRLANAPASVSTANPTPTTETKSSSTVATTKLPVPSTTDLPVPTTKATTSNSAATTKDPRCLFLDGVLAQLNSQNVNIQVCIDLSFITFKAICPSEVASIEAKCAELNTSTTAP